MNDRCLVDTNVLVYARDSSEGAKAALANELLARLTATQRAVTSPQILAEFFATTTRPRSNRTPLLTKADALVWTLGWLTNWDCLSLDERVSELALSTAVSRQMHVYDAQIWATAAVHGIETIITEDTPGGRSRLEGIRYINPFARSFTLASLGL